MSEFTLLLGTATGAAPPAFGLWALFTQSFDVFTVILVAGSITAVAVVVNCILEVRGGRIAPKASSQRILDLAASDRWDELRDFVARDDSFVGKVVRAAMAAARLNPDPGAIRDAAELAGAEESARWFRRIELLNVIGNLGPLVGLAGTVWGMILAFTSLGESGGQAGPAALSLGISKALFHTLLGLCLAIPCLLTFGIYRSNVERICTGAMAIAGSAVERLAAQSARARG